MEHWAFDSQACDFDLLGQDFLELLSQPLGHYTFNHPTEEYSCQADDWFEFQDLVCLSPTEDSMTVNVLAPDRMAAETSNLLEGYGGNADYNLTSKSKRQPLRHSSKAPETRKFEDCLSEFAISKASDKIIRRRKRFSNERRKEVDHIRKAGACIRCRLMKTACKLELPCSSCIKACHSIDLGRTLCIRQKLTDVRFIADLWDRTEDLAWLQEEVPALFGARKTLSISLAVFCDANSFIFNTDIDSVIWAAGGHEGPWTVANPLEVVIQDFKPRPGMEHRHIFYLSSCEGWTAKDSAPQFYAIPEDSLPNLDTLEAWALDTARNHPRAFIGGINGSFLSLARRYCECKRPLPLQDLMRKAVRLTCLHGIWYSDFPRPRDSKQESHQYASNAVYRQLSAIAAQGIVDAEVEVLSLLQKCIFGKEGPGRQNMLPIWTSLWLLILVYRRTLYYYDKHGRKRELYQLANHMYDLLVSIYSGLFRPSSPLWLNWLRDDVYELFGRDWRITEAMGTLKTEIGHYANGGTSSDIEFESHDALLQSLIFNHEKRLGKKLMEKPPSQDSKIEIQPASSGSNYFLVDKDLVLPKTIQGLDQGNRLYVVKETSLGVNGWVRWPAPLYNHDERV